jgi:putative ABC transport system substrate-binding protein
VAILVATDRPSAVAARAATATIPIVFTSGFDPVQLGLVVSFNRPGGNATGVSLLTTELGPKRLGLVRELLPKPGTIAFVVNPKSAATPFQIQEMQAAAQAVGQELLVVCVGTEDEVDQAFATMAERNVAAITDPLVNTHRIRVNTLALAARLPTMHFYREYVEAGGLMSYGPNLPDLLRRAVDYVDKILRGAKPGDIPVEQPTKFDLIVNLTTAKALGLTIPESFLLRADEVIE